jgi:hypothetical protein
VLDQLQSSDSSYAQVSRAHLDGELTALRLELIALAWGHHFRKEEYTIPQSSFTRDYLLQANRSEAWDVMGEYNQSVARSAYFQMAQQRGYFPKRDENIMRSCVAHLDKERMDWFASHVGTSSDPKCTARIANRIGNGPGWQQGIGIKIIAAAVTERLGCEPQAAGRDHLVHALRMLYEGSLAAIESVRIQAS